MENIILKFEKSEFKLSLRGEADTSVMREIFKLREYRRAEEVIKQAQDPILDVGAHAGFFSLYCRALNPVVKILGLEPEKNNLEFFAKHLKNNKIKDVAIIAGALAGKTGERVLKISSDSHNHRLNDNRLPEVFLSKAGYRDETEVKVRVFSLFDLCRLHKIKKLSLIKMDIEGGEFEVFESLMSEDYLLFQSIILEYHNNIDHYQIIENKLRVNGFGVQVFPSKFDKTMGFIFASNKRGASIST
ncbi:MAG: FkbM family methyltransferase [Candidatus Magasanikbacteria bacterium]